MQHCLLRHPPSSRFPPILLMISSFPLICALDSVFPSVSCLPHSISTKHGLTSSASSLPSSATPADWCSFPSPSEEPYLPGQPGENPPSFSGCYQDIFMRRWSFWSLTSPLGVTSVSSFINASLWSCLLFFLSVLPSSSFLPLCLLPQSTFIWTNWY